VSAIVDDVVRRLSAGVDGDLGIPGKVMKFDAGEDGVVVLDSSTTPAQVTATDRTADCTIKMAAVALKRILAGEMSCGAAYMIFTRGVEGDQALAVLVQPFLRRVAETTVQPR
jgi:putative sterol carrier protein